jgi:hypothetical protein
MSRMQPQRMSFSDIVLERWTFMNSFGFKCVSRFEDKLIFESNKVRITVSHGQRDGEVSMSFGRIALGEDYSFVLFLRKTSPGIQSSMGEMLANDTQEIFLAVRKLGDALQQAGVGILHGFDSVFEEMKDVRWWNVG